MTASDKTNSTMPDNAAVAAPRPVTVKHVEPHDGRLPISVTFVPVVNLDAKGGVFIDFRQGSKAQQPGAMRTTKPAMDAARAPSERKLKLVKGNEAIAALAAKEAKSFPIDTASPVVVKAIKAIKRQSNPITSHQIAKPAHFTTGQSETFRAEVSMPGGGTPELGEWYFRGRIATNGAPDLHSAWQKVTS